MPYDAEAKQPAELFDPVSTAYIAISIVPITITIAPGNRCGTSFSRRKRKAHNKVKTELILNRAETYPTSPRLKAA